MSVYRKALSGLTLALTLSALGVSANAQEYLANWATVQTNGKQILFTSNGAGGGTLSLGSTPLSVALTDVLGPFPGPVDLVMSSVFTPLLTKNIATNQYTGTFGGGTFTFTDPGGTLLSGSFNSLFFTANLSGGISMSANGITLYDPTGTVISDFNAFATDALSNPLPDSNLTGNMSITSVAIKHGANLTLNGFTEYTYGGGTPGLGSFGASVVGTFDTGVAPEPGEWAAMGILASGLGGLVVRARRRRA